MDRRPSWQSEPCPAWCVGGHQENDHPDDRVHRSTSFPVPVVLRRSEPEGERMARRIEHDDFEVALSRVDGESDTWLYVGNGPGMHLDVTVESARRLLRAASIRLTGQ